ncbi:hypothetical protein [Paenibacillus sp. GCM10027626]|uniref:hypothetical protein n=1 Tax=Paenibacillus sp. GCM10027626 TaxID=3273411 RepID=UPI003638F605
MIYVSVFIFNFVVACFIYDQSGYVKPLLQAVLVTLLIVAIDIIKYMMKAKQKRKA